MPCITLITAVHPPAAPHLADAYKSLCEQELPLGWQWQWVIQEDGESDEVAPYVPDDVRISFGQGRPGGPGVTRTMALSRVDGDLIKTLDADDMLTPGVLARDIAVLTEHPEIGWTTSRVLDLLPDGSTVGFDQDPPEGPIERGAVLEHWQANNHRAQVHPATMCLRRDLLLALGGWMAMPASEDTGLLLAANTVARGYFHAEAGLLYRKWHGQETSQAAHSHPGERDARMAVVEARVRALKFYSWQHSVRE